MDDKRAVALVLGLLGIVCLCVCSLLGILPLNLNTLNPDQILLGAIIFIVSMLVGLAWKLVLDAQNSDAEITWTEYVIGGLVVGILFALIGVNIGWNMAWNNKVTYHEYWNGWELQAVVQEIQCTRDGPCYHEYSCDPYWVTEYYDCNCDDDGCDRCSRQVEKTHDCPYATSEFVHTIQTTLGDYTIDDHIYSSNPAEWRAGSGIPGNIQRGPSQIWLDAKARCEAKQPGPVTKRMDYENLILASDSTILKQYSDQIEAYKNAGLLPDLQRGVQNWYYADKVYFVGYTPTDAFGWQWSHAVLNSAFGTESQGDLHLVIVQNDFASANPDAYVTALKAYWQNPEVWEKDAISKNSVIVVLGTKDGQTITWARATTGMPLGNEMMATVIRDRMKGVQLSPQAVLGTVKSEFYVKTYDDGSTKVKVRGTGEDGALRRILWGMDEPASKFVRVSMSADDADDVGTGFKYLAREIKPSTSQQVWIVIISVLLSCVVWFVVAYLIGERERRRRSRYNW